MEVVPASGQRAASGPDLDQFSREPRQNARTCRVQNDIVLDADAAPPGTVDSWLDRDNGALGERTLGGASETWRFMHLETDAMSVKRITPSVIVCNNPHQMRVFGVENVSHCDRALLNVYVARGTHGLGLVWLIVRAAFRTLDSARRFEAFTVLDVTIHTRRPTARVSIDGEVVDLPTPLRYSVRKAALKVVEPVE